MKWEGVKILECEHDYWKRRVLEAIWIEKNREVELQPGVWSNAEPELVGVHLVDYNIKPCTSSEL